MKPISQELLDILVCPETHQKLKMMEPAEFGRLTQLQRQGQLKNRAGEPVKEQPEAALVREDGEYAYLILEEIPVMLVDEAIPLNQLKP